MSLAERMRGALTNVDNTIFSLIPTINTWIDEVESLEAVTVVSVDLGGDSAFEIVATPNTATAGMFIFMVHNIGAFTHECLVIKTDETAAEIVASVGVGELLDESLYDIRVDSGDIAAGEYLRLDATLEAGHYALVCNETGHTHLGMATDFEVF